MRLESLVDVGWGMSFFFWGGGEGEQPLLDRMGSSFSGFGGIVKSVSALN